MRKRYQTPLECLSTRSLGGAGLDLAEESITIENHRSMLDVKIGQLSVVWPN